MGATLYDLLRLTKLDVEKPVAIHPTLSVRFVYKILVCHVHTILLCQVSQVPALLMVLKSLQPSEINETYG